MHGRPRLPKGQLPDPEKVKAQEQKAALFGKLLREVLSRRNAKQMDEESMGLCAKLLELNPEVYTGWNYRREFLDPILREGGAEALRWVEAELHLTFKALQRNPKSYHTWHHRKWLVAKRMCSIEKELELVSMLLNMDERNFHAWTYRKFLSALQGLTPNEELAYAKGKIDQNFSNYSAWHYRTSLLPQIYDPRREDGADSIGVLLSQLAHLSEQVAAAAEQDAEQGRQGVRADGEEAPTTSAPTAHGPDAGSGSREGRGAPSVRPSPSPSHIPLAVLDEEFDLVRQAFFTEPNDQSGWFYHRWLLAALKGKLDPRFIQLASSFPAGEGADDPAATKDRVLSAMEREARMCSELIEIEPECKWALLARAHILEILDEIGGKEDERRGEIRALLEQLVALDPDRAGYYRDRLARCS